jgi:RNA polymerase sigma-70 factor (ECF subfamily)
MMAGDMEDVKKWLQAVRDREEQALRELIDLYAAPLRRFIHGIVRNPHDSEDLAQEAFLRFLNHPQDFADLKQLRNYLFQIAHNLAITKVTSAPSRREENVEEFPEVRMEEGSTARLERLEREKEVKELLYALPPQQRKVVILKNWEDLTFREIGEVLGLAEGTVKAHYFFALRKMKKSIGEKGDKENDGATGR